MGYLILLVGIVLLIGATKEKRAFVKLSLIFFGVLLTMGGIVKIIDKDQQVSNPQQKSQPENQPAPSEIQKESKSQISIPYTQKEFISAVTSVVTEYNAAPNELKKSLVRSKRAKLLSKVLNNSKTFSKWVGKITNMGTNRDGKAYIEIELAESTIKVKTWNNSLSDYGDNTMISQGNKLYNFIAELSEGEQVIVSGTFLPPDNELDFIRETSFTESGSISSPEFVVKILHLAKN